MAYADQAALAIDVAFQARIRVGLLTAASQVMGEAKGSFSDAQYGKRQALAYAVLATGGRDHVERFAWGVTANPAINSGSNDGDIQFTINSLWDDMSGVTAQDGA